MNKITKKAINNFLGNKKSWSPFGWRVDQCGAYLKDGEFHFYTGYKGQVINANVYNNEYDTIVDCTDVVKEWINGEYTKEFVTDEIYTRCLNMMEEYNNERI